MAYMDYGRGAPFDYDYMNVTESSRSPSTVHTQNTHLVAYFRRYLLQKAMSVFKWTMPKQWDKDYFLYCLYCWGFIAVLNTPRYGVIPQGCGLKGYNVFYRPREVIVTNPLFYPRKSVIRTIDVDCVLFKLQPDYGSIMDLINYYAEQMALCAEAKDVNLINSKLSYVFAAESKTAAESMKKLYDRIASGEPAVVVDKALISDDGKAKWMPFEQNVGQNYIVSDILSDMRIIEAQFNTDIGIPNANTDKRERLNTDEVNANNVETATRCEMWLDSLKECCGKVKEMFGADVSVEWRHEPEVTNEEGGAANESNN